MIEPIDRVGELKRLVDGSGREYWCVSEDTNKLFRVIRNLPRFSQTLCNQCADFGNEKGLVYTTERRTGSSGWMRTEYFMLNEHRSLGCATVELKQIFKNYQVDMLNRSLRRSV